MSIELVVLVAYMIVLMGIGLAVYGRTKDLGDYLLGGRTVGPAATALTMQSTNLSGYMFQGAPAYAFSTGWFSMWYALGDAIGSVISFGVLGRRMRRLSQQLGALTPIEYLEARYESSAVRAIGAIISLIFMAAYILAQFVAAGKSLAFILGIPYSTALFWGVLVILFYTTLGGYLAVVWTDVLQAVVMLVGMFGLLVAVLFRIGGLTALNEGLARLDPTYLSIWGKDLQYEGQWAFAIGAVLVYGVGLMGLPHLVVRHMSTRSVATAKRALVWSAVWNQFFVYSPYLLGMSALILLPQIDDPELIIPGLARLIFPGVGAAIVLSAMLAAIMSTSDSILMQAGSILSRDIYQRFLKPNATNRQMLVASRLIILLIGVVGYILALVEPPAIFSLVVFAYGVLGNSFLVPYVAAVYWPAANKVGAVAAMIGGAATNVAWEVLGLAGPTAVHPFLAGLVASFLCMIIFNRFGQSPSAEIVNMVHNLSGPRAAVPAGIAQGATRFLRTEAKAVQQFLSAQV